MAVSPNLQLLRLESLVFNIRVVVNLITELIKYEQKNSVLSITRPANLEWGYEVGWKFWGWFYVLDIAVSSADPRPTAGRACDVSEHLSLLSMYFLSIWHKILQFGEYLRFILRTWKAQKQAGYKLHCYIDSLVTTDYIQSIERLDCNNTSCCKFSLYQSGTNLAYSAVSRRMRAVRSDILCEVPYVFKSLTVLLEC